MAYTTYYEGVLEFKMELRTEQYKHLHTILGENCRDHPEWGTNGLSWINFTLTPGFEGLEWDGSEDSHDMIGQANLIITEMRKIMPQFMLSCQLLAQGDEPRDRWLLKINDHGWAEREIVPVPDDLIVCPQCHHRFVYQSPIVTGDTANV